MKIKHQCPDCYTEVQFKVLKEHYFKNITFSCSNCGKLFVYYTDGETITVKEIP